MNNSQRQIDEESRIKIKNNIDENYFVEAGAGSGKTTVLVDRMVKMIEEDKDISHISAITFTKAAANEFYDRFQKKLIEKSLEENNENKQKYLDALQKIDLAFMGTIDSFCNMIMSEHPNEGNIPSNSKVIDDDKAQELYKREYANIQNGSYNDTELEEKARLFLSYDNYPVDTFINVLNALLNHRDCEIQVPRYTTCDLDNEYQDEIKTIRKIVHTLNKNPNFFNCKNNEENEKCINEFSRFKNAFDVPWNDNIGTILNAYKKTLGNKELRLYNDPTVEQTLKEGMDYFILHDTRKPYYYELDPDKLPVIFKKIEEEKYAVTLDFVNSAKDKILAKLKKEGSLTFSDYLIYLRDALRKDANGDGKLIKHIYERHKYFLIDEFQDTDPIQAEIFFYLAAKDIKPNWRDCVPYKGSLFIVGDPKQSIYRFKNADVASYLKVKEMFENPKIGEVLYLYKNFRSTYEIKDWFNNTFTNMLTDSDEQAQYEEIPIDVSERQDGVTAVYKYEEPFRKKEDCDEDEYKVRDIILKLKGNKDYTISDKKKENNEVVYFTRLLDWKDFMVITPTKPALSRYTKLFREMGIPYYVEGNIKFNESKAFMMFVNFFGAIINPHDNRYLYSVLTSNLFNISEEELSKAIANNFVFNVTSTYEQDDKLNKALVVLNEFVNCAKIMNPSSLFTKIINEVEAFKKQGNENMEYVYFALELLKTKEDNKEIVSNNDALKFFEKLLYEENDQERCPGLKKDGNQVHLANLHKIKGLEAPVVILARPTSRKRKPTFRMERDPKGNKGYLFEVQKKYKNLYIPLISTDQYEEPYRNNEEVSAEAEKLRLEYVAATRAKNILIIGDTVTSTGHSKANPWFDLIDAPSSTNLINIEDQLRSVEAKSYKQEAIKYDELEKPSNIIETNKEDLEKSSFEISNPSRLTNTHVSEDVEVDSLTQEQAYENKGDTYATIIGTMVHRLMEMIVLGKDKLKKEDIINNIINEYLTLDFEDKKDVFIKKLNDVYDTIHNGGYVQKGKATQDILPILLSADHIYSEVPFTYKENNIIWNGIIDLVYEKDHKLHVIDWKTNKDDSGLDEHYHNQLEAYKKAIKDTIGSEVEDAYIYHIDIKGA